MATAKKKTKKVTKKATSRKGVGGQPTKYRPEYCKELIEYMASGRSLTSFSHHINVGRSTLYDWKKTIPEFSDAIKTGMAKAEAWWEEQGLMGLWNPKGFNTTLFIFTMKTRFGWREESSVNLTIDAPDVSYNTKKMSKEEYRDFLKERIKKNLE